MGASNGDFHQFLNEFSVWHSAHNALTVLGASRLRVFDMRQDARSYLGESAGLVRANHGHAAERLDGRQLAHDRLCMCGCEGER